MENLLEHLVPLLLQTLLPFALGLALSRFLGGPLLPVLQELCGTRERADFWLHWSTLAFSLAPPCWILVADIGNSCLTLDALRSILGHSILVDLLGLAVLARILLKRIPPAASQDSPIAPIV